MKSDGHLPKQILLTCDTELGEVSRHFDAQDSFDFFVEGKYDGQQVGFDFLNQTASDFGAKMTHFLDVYPAKNGLEKRFSNLVERALNQGHEVELHTHPSWQFDERRIFMFQYSEDEQREILAHGIKLLQKWSGKQPLAHRAGGYGADNRIFKLLSEFEIRFDSSYYFRYRNCPMEGLALNKTQAIEGVVEVPITVFDRQQRYAPGFKKAQRTQLDLRMGLSIKEIEAVLDQSPPGAILVFFFHSFNFLQIPFNSKTRKFGKPAIDRQLMESYRSMLKMISGRNDCSFATFGDLRMAEHEPFFPKVSVSASFSQKIKSKWQIWKGIDHV